MMISLNQPLSWLSNTGFKLVVKNEHGHDSHIKMNYSVHPDNIRNVAGAINRFGNFIQNGVDPWGGDLVLALLMGNRLPHFVLFGDVPAEGKSFKDAKDYHHHPIFNVAGSGYTQIQQAVLKDVALDVINVAKGSQALLNDVWGDGSKERVTIYDIQKRKSNLDRVFGTNKNEFIFNRLLNRYKRTKNKEMENALYTVFFGGSATETSLRDQFNLDRVKERVNKKANFW